MPKVTIRWREKLDNLGAEPNHRPHRLASARHLTTDTRNTSGQKDAAPFGNCVVKGTKILGTALFYLKRRRDNRAKFQKASESYPLTRRMLGSLSVPT